MGGLSPNDFFHNFASCGPFPKLHTSIIKYSILFCGLFDIHNFPMWGDTQISKFDTQSTGLIYYNCLMFFMKDLITEMCVWIII